MVTQIRGGDGDFGLLGSDKYDELQEVNDLIYEPIGKLACQFVLAAPEGKDLPEVPTIATSYPQALQNFLARTGIQARFGKLMPGKVESAPERGFADAIFDIKQTGNSLKANNLRIVRIGETLQLGGLWRQEGVEDFVDFNVNDYMKSLETIEKRSQGLKEGRLPQTYTEILLASQNEQIKKLASETGELIREICRPDFDQERFVGEASDLVYAVEVACAAQDISFINILNELANRNNKE